MTTLTFDATLKDGNIVIPATYFEQLNTLFKDKKIRITVVSAEKAANPITSIDDWQKTHTSFIQYLIENPIEMAHPVRLTKEELHER